MLVVEMISGYIYALLSAYRNDTYQQYWVPLELLFLVDLLLHFFLDFSHSHKTSQNSVRDFEQIVAHYIGGDLLFDLIPLIPFQMLSLKNNAQNMFFAIKVIRIFKGVSKASIS